RDRGTLSVGWVSCPYCTFSGHERQAGISVKYFRTPDCVKGTKQVRIASRMSKMEITMSALPIVPNHKTRRAALKLDRLGPVLPPPERRQHDPVALVEERDPDGWPVRHCKAVDTIGRLVRNGLVRPEWAVAADRFRRDYRIAQFDPLSANDL